MMTGSSDTECDCRTRFSVSMPLMPGIITSSRTASMRLLPSISSARGPLSAVSTV